MKKINLAISGCMGRMGQQLIKSIKKNNTFKLVSLTENRKINKKISGIKPQINSLKSFKNTNVIIDFTVPNCTLEILKIASNTENNKIISNTCITTVIVILFFLCFVSSKLIFCYFNLTLILF